MLLTVDPGLHNCGAALWTPNGRLVVAWLAVGSADARGALCASPMIAALRGSAERRAHVAGGSIEELAIEIPRVYPRERSKGDPNDLIDLTTVVGACLAVFSGTQTVYRPSEWKGTLPKDVTIARAKRDLSLEEQARFEACAASLAHNVWDAAALGLAHLRKSGRRP